MISVERFKIPKLITKSNIRKIFDIDWLAKKIRKLFKYNSGIIDFYDLVKIRWKYPSIPPSKKNLRRNKIK